MRALVLVAFLLSIQLLMAQQVVMSEPEKLSSKTPNASILGKSNEGIIVYKYGRGTDIIEAYNSNMGVRWKKTLNIQQENSSILKMVLYPAKTVVFFLSENKNYSVVYAQALSSKFDGDGKFVVVDTIEGNKIDLENDLSVVHSQNRSQLLVYYPVSNNGALQYLQAVGMSENLEVSYRGRINLPADVAAYQLSGVVPDNQGNLSILLERKERFRKSETNKEFRVFYYRPETGLLSEIDFKLQRPIFGSIGLEVDNVNRRIVLTGLYSNDGEKDARGYFFEAYSPFASPEEAYTSYYQHFPGDLIFQVTGKDTSTYDKGLFSFRIKDIILRQDGGAIFITESQFDNTENIEMPSFGPASGPSIRTVKVHYYNDILVVSVKPSGEMDWYSIMKKKQVSEDDEGFYSSFSIVNTNDMLRFIYNDEIYYKANVNQYSMDSKGQSVRSLLFNSGEKELLLVPSIAKQISANELIIPSFRKNSLRFVKISF
ncbi:MAG: hypothetical protein SFW35_04050 [Chitinophagales bacterium]|nr:hypothetical protein [Chitinophagales bacterium]